MPACATCSASSARARCFILDEAHHAAPSGGRALCDLQPVHRGRARACRALRASPVPDRHAAQRALQQLLGAPGDARPAALHARRRGSRREDLEPVMVRRLKADLRRLGEAFPERKVEPISIAGLPADAPSSISGAGSPPTASCARAASPSCRRTRPRWPSSPSSACSSGCCPRSRRSPARSRRTARPCSGWSTGEQQQVPRPPRRRSSTAARPTKVEDLAARRRRRPRQPSTPTRTRPPRLPSVVGAADASTADLRDGVGRGR